MSIGKEEAKMLHDSIYRPEVKYTIGQSFLSYVQHKNIKPKSLSWIIAKYGYNRNISRKNIFGPSYLGGAGFVPLQAKQGTDIILHLLKHWRSPTEKTGKLIRVVLGWTQYQSGMHFPILQNTTIPLPYVAGRFMITLRFFLHQLGGKFEVDQPYIPKILRKKDIAIMYHAVNLKIYNQHQLKCINVVRMYLRVMYLSEMSNTDSTRLRRQADTLSIDYVPKSNVLHQPKPNLSSFILWEDLLTSLTISTTRQLRSPLGS